MFLVFRVREELRRGLTPHEAVVQSVSRVGESISFSAFTVIAALLSLVLAEFAFYQSLGPALAIGIALMLLAGLTLLPGAARDPRSCGLLAHRRVAAHARPPRALGSGRRVRDPSPGADARWQASSCSAVSR